VTLQQLTYFLAAAEHGSFTAAADALHLARPSVSEQIAHLEDEFGGSATLDACREAADVVRSARTHEGIRVNAICPGPVRSPMSEQACDASVEITPLRRRAEPEEIAAAVAFLASDDAVDMTGAELAVDGGYLAR
jgi:Enoyl-(Acyl carrier protein) reductase/Bacterial regulatory helix-turn-helix protein, lysR family